MAFTLHIRPGFELQSYCKAVKMQSETLFFTPNEGRHNA